MMEEKHFISYKLQKWNGTIQNEPQPKLLPDLPGKLILFGTNLCEVWDSFQFFSEIIFYQRY